MPNLIPSLSLYLTIPEVGGASESETKDLRELSFFQVEIIPIITQWVRANTNDETFSSLANKIFKISVFVDVQFLEIRINRQLSKPRLSLATVTVYSDPGVLTYDLSESLYTSI